TEFAVDTLRLLSFRFLKRLPLPSGYFERSDSAVCRRISCSRPPGSLGNGGAVGSYDLRFDVLADCHRCLVVAPADALAVPDELGLVSHLHLAPIVRPGHPVPLTCYLSVVERWVLAGENLSGDQRERICGLPDNVVITRYQRVAVSCLRRSV